MSSQNIRVPISLRDLKKYHSWSCIGFPAPGAKVCKEEWYETTEEKLRLDSLLGNLELSPLLSDDKTKDDLNLIASHFTCGEHKRFASHYVSHWLALDSLDHFLEHMKWTLEVSSWVCLATKTDANRCEGLGLRRLSDDEYCTEVYRALNELAIGDYSHAVSLVAILLKAWTCKRHHQTVTPLLGLEATRQSSKQPPELTRILREQIKIVRQIKTPQTTPRNKTSNPAGLFTKAYESGGYLNLSGNSDSVSRRKKVPPDWLIKLFLKIAQYLHETGKDVDVDLSDSDSIFGSKFGETGGGETKSDENEESENEDVRSKIKSGLEMRSEYEPVSGQSSASKLFYHHTLSKPKLGLNFSLLSAPNTTISHNPHDIEEEFIPPESKSHVTNLSSGEKNATKSAEDESVDESPRIPKTDVLNATFPDPPLNAQNQSLDVPDQSEISDSESAPSTSQLDFAEHPHIQDYPGPPSYPRIVEDLNELSSLRLTHVNLEASHFTFKPKLTLTERLNPRAVAEKIFRIMGQKISSKTHERGKIYISEIRGRPGYVKIGRSVQQLSDRQNQLEKICKYASFMIVAKECYVELNNHQRVEVLVHAELSNERQVLKCLCTSETDKQHKTSRKSTKTQHFKTSCK